ncbi:hypothetical protein [Actinomadura hibisca]|uniref:hypothetical protein n=1 Tax=Actinomadura hibisca TaxID=68565 RepID=UPI00083736B9|nr:hypothetical protein [Actinomadura hibisca]
MNQRGMTPAALHRQTTDRVQSAMAIAMRADNARIADVLLAGNGLAPQDAAFVREARGLTLAFAAALLTVLRVHRPGHDPYGVPLCLGCGRPQCRTVAAVAELLTAYRVRFAPVDRAEAWRRADRWFAEQCGSPRPLTVEEFGTGFAVRAVAFEGVLVVDRDTGALSRWPNLPTPDLAEQHQRYQRGHL